MADRMPAEIWVGGKLSRNHLNKIPITGLKLDWDENPIDTRSVESILAARDDQGLLHFCDDGAAWGEFEELETSLQELQLPFRRRSSGKYDYLPELFEFRPDIIDPRDGKAIVIETISTDDGEPLVYRSDLAPFLAEMAALARPQASSPESQLTAWRRLAEKVARLLPPELPPLPPFEIV
jgi:hypothetical protein